MLTLETILTAGCLIGLYLVSSKLNDTLITLKGIQEEIKALRSYLYDKDQAAKYSGYPTD